MQKHLPICNSAICSQTIIFSADEQTWGLAMRRLLLLLKPGNIRTFSVEIPLVTHMKHIKRSANANFRSEIHNP